MGGAGGAQRQVFGPWAPRARQITSKLQSLRQARVTEFGQASTTEGAIRVGNHFPLLKSVPKRNNPAMTKELDAARNALETALGEYMHACLNIQSPGVTSEIIHPESPSAIASAALVKEYLRVASLEKQIQQAKAAIVTLSSSSSAKPLANNLPAEVLVCIFQLAAQSEPCKLDPWSSEYERLPHYPTQLAHVCARWRQIIINTPFFWSHIDITPLLESRERLRYRTQTFIARAAHAPLDIHITSPYPTDECWETTGLKEFLAPLVPRMRSLDVDIQIDENQEDYDPEPSARDFCSSILSICFDTGSTPGILTQLTLEMETNYIFLKAIENAEEDQDLPVVTSEKRLEEIWRHVSVLRLTCLFPFWTSSAYSGLVELSLSTHNWWRGVTISENHLVGIFSSSPQLRVVELRLPIVSSDTPCKAVTLVDLETLVLQPTTTNELETVMRLIIPGPKPLHVTISTMQLQESQDEAFKTTTETAKFVAHSNIIVLHFIGTKNCFKILGLVETIENIAFTTYRAEDISLVCNKPLRLFAKKIYLLSEREIDLEIGVLRELIRVYAPKNFTLRGSYRFLRAGTQVDNITEIEEELATPGTIVKVLISKPPPTNMCGRPLASFMYI